MSDATPHLPDAEPRRAYFPFPSGRWLALFALVVVLFYAAGISAHWRFQRDSTLYMGLARSLAENGTFSFNGEPERLALPGFPAMLSLIYMSVGESFLTMNVLMALFGLGCVALGWLVFRRQPLTGPQALACLVLLGLSRTLFYYSSHVITDVPFTFFTLLGLYCGARMLQDPSRPRWPWCLAAACATTAACSVRPLGLALLIGVAGALWLRAGALRQWRESLAWTALLAAPTLAVAALWVHRGAAVGTAAGTSYFHWFLGVRGLIGAALHVLERVPMVVASLSDTLLGSDLGRPASVALALPIAIGFVVELRRGERLLCIFGVVYAGAVCLANPGRRFMLPMLPALLVWLVLGAQAVAAFVARRGHAVRPASLARAGWVLVALMALTNMAHASKTIYEAHSANFYATIEDGRLPDYFRLVGWLRENARSDDCVLANESSFITYFSRVRTRRIAMEGMAFDPRDQAQRMKLAGVTYLLADSAGGDAARKVDELMRAHPDAFDKVQTFGKLDLYRVHLDKM